nr:hypothetical protein [Tanacetum cinerariifolium]
MSFEEIEAKLTQVWKRIEDFTPMGSKEEAERAKRQGIILEKEQVKKQKLSEEALESKTPIEEIIRLGGSTACYQLFIDLLKQLDREDLNQLWALVKEYLSIRPASNDKEMKLWV